jgi:diguanylate cyclase (GGDEF)-like protein/PAS domain S-box-containing protein
MAGRQRSAFASVSRRETSALAALLVVMVVSLVALSAFGMRTISAARAYVEGEGQWSKRQKDAVSHLTRYAGSGSPADYASFEAALAVPLGDRRARLELEKPTPDLRSAFEGFLQGRNAAEDIPNMIWLFRRFRHFAPMAEAIRLWSEGDRWIAELQTVGAELRAEMVSTAPRRERVAELVARIAEVDRSVSPLEDDFSRTLGEAARWAHDLVFRVLVIAAVVLLGVGLVVSRRIQGRARASRRALEIEARKTLAILDQSLDGVIGMGADGRVSYWNPRAEAMFGWTSKEAIGVLLADLIVPERLRERHRRGLEHFLATGSGPVVGSRIELSALRRDGSEFPVELNIAAIRELEGYSFSAFVADLSSRKQAERIERELTERLARQALYDGLTGLPNRQLFEDRLAAVLSLGPSEGRCGVVFVDIDDFKSFNDTMGHAGGDRVLRGVAQRLLELVREGDTVARVGGDEFLLLLPRVGRPVDAQRVAQKLLAGLAPPIAVDGREVAVQFSLGASLHPEDGTDLATLVRNADVAMYRAKERGGRTCQWFVPELHARAAERLKLEQSLRAGVHGDQFALHYQPMVEAATGKVRGAEALLRWNHPERGLLAPGEFLAVAEATGLIVPIGAWVLYTACRDLKQWHDLGHRDLMVSVNMSARQFLEGDLVSQAGAALALHGLPPERLEIEVTETLRLLHDEATQTILSGLRRLGVRLAIDDFGVGYATLSYLRTLSPDTLKIDRSFVLDLERDPVAVTIAGTVAELGRTLELRVVAEGVETEAQRELLTRYGCTFLQGYLFGAAMPAEEFARRLG